MVACNCKLGQCLSLLFSKLLWPAQSDIQGSEKRKKSSCSSRNSGMVKKLADLLFQGLIEMGLFVSLPPSSFKIYHFLAWAECVCRLMDLGMFGCAGKRSLDN